MDVTWIVIGAVILAIVIIALIVSTIARSGLRIPTDQERQEAFGKHGENVVFKMLKQIADESGGYAYENVAFKDDNGYSTEIDAILICKGGFFAIEVKANKGIITGCLDDELWYAEKEEWQDDRRLKNPVKQNQGHINHLKRMAGKGFPYITSIVIFPYAKSISAVRSEIVHDYYSARDFILAKIAEGKYKKETVDRFNNQLQSFLSRYGISHEEHIRAIREKFEADIK